MRKHNKRKTQLSSKEIDRREIQRLVSSGVPLDPDTRIPIIGFKEPPLVADEIEIGLNSQSVLNLEM
jgi:hypothetical protein